MSVVPVTGRVATPPHPPSSVAEDLGPPATSEVDTRALAIDLLNEVDGEVRFDAGSRALYAADASNYRQLPIGVVVPHTVEGAVKAVEVARRHGAPLVNRGGGTALAGQTCNAAVLLDFSKYVNRILELDPAR
jgi:FAD/FMN-containing dehydrogenase